jgi:small subunit ribosomal protein S16
MEVKIRLQRAGKSSKGRYNYRIVAISRTKPRDSKHIEVVGYYDAAKNPAVISVNNEKLDKWVKNGAQMSSTVKSLIKKAQKSEQSV